MDGELIPLEFFQVPPTSLHREWQWLAEGLADIMANVVVDWKPEDVYTAIATNRAECFIIQRAQRKLGFFTGFPQPRIYSNLPEYVLWHSWSLPIFERTPEDRASYKDDIIAADKFVEERARHWHCVQIGAYTKRNGIESLGYRLQYHYFVKHL